MICSENQEWSESSIQVKHEPINSEQSIFRVMNSHWDKHPDFPLDCSFAMQINNFSMEFENEEQYCLPRPAIFNTCSEQKQFSCAECQTQSSSIGQGSKKLTDNVQSTLRLEQLSKKIQSLESKMGKIINHYETIIDQSSSLSQTRHLLRENYQLKRYIYIKALQSQKHPSSRETFFESDKSAQRLVTIQF